MKKKFILYGFCLRQQPMWEIFSQFLQQKKVHLEHNNLIYYYKVSIYIQKKIIFLSQSYLLITIHYFIKKIFCFKLNKNQLLSDLQNMKQKEYSDQFYLYFYRKNQVWLMLVEPIKLSQYFLMLHLDLQLLEIYLILHLYNILNFYDSY